jgi:membrane protease YdiL (CAAX protease family)
MKTTSFDVEPSNETSRLQGGTKRKPATFVFVVFCLFFWLPDSWLRTEPLALGAAPLIVSCASSVIVGCWEEILYRGFFFNALREWKGAKAAVWGSSFLFTIMHIQASEGWLLSRATPGNTGGLGFGTRLDRLRQLGPEVPVYMERGHFGKVVKRWNLVVPTELLAGDWESAA